MQKEYSYPKDNLWTIPFSIYPTQITKNIKRQAIGENIHAYLWQIIYIKNIESPYVKNKMTNKCMSKY